MIYPIRRRTENIDIVVVECQAIFLYLLTWFSQQPYGENSIPISHKRKVRHKEDYYLSHDNKCNKVCAGSGDYEPNCNILLLHQAAPTTSEYVVFICDVGVLNYKQLFFHCPSSRPIILHPMLLVTEHVADAYLLFELLLIYFLGNLP